MKKILLAWSVMIFAITSLNAQQKQSLLTPSQGSDVKPIIINYPSTDVIKNQHSKTRGGSVFLSYLDFVAVQENITAANISLNSSLNFMFPDSSVRFNPPNLAYGISFKSIGQVLDPKAPVFTNNMPAGTIVFTNTNAYTLDSVFVLGSYAKLSNAVDTLIISVLQSAGNNLPEYYYSNQSTNWGVDTTRFLAMFYTPSNFNVGPYQVNPTGGSAPLVIKHVLTNSDSSYHQMGSNQYFTKYLGFSTNSFSVPAGEKVSVSFTFKPGFTYSAGDSIGKNNHYLFMSTQPNGSNTFMPYYPGDFNQSTVITKDSSNGYSGFYIPSLAFTAPYQTEMHNIIFKVSCPTCNPLCNYALSVPNYLCATGAANTYNAISNVIADTGCPWTANVTSGGTWLTSTSTGVGNGSISITVQANTTGSSRTGTILVGSQTLSIIQPSQPIGIVEVEQENSFTLYPNPSNDMVMINIKKEWIGSTFNITNLEGKIVIHGNISSTSMPIDIRHLAQGKYLVQIAGLPSIKKLIKN